MVQQKESVTHISGLVVHQKRNSSCSHILGFSASQQLTQKKFCSTCHTNGRPSL